MDGNATSSYLDPARTSLELSRTSSATSSNSPARPPKAESRRSSISPEAARAAATDAPMSQSQSQSQPPISPRSPSQTSRLSGLNVVTSSPLAAIRAGSTPVSPLPQQQQQQSSMTYSQVPTLYHSSSRPELDADRVSHTSFGQTSNGSASLTGHASPALASSPPVAAFTAGMQHTINHGQGPLKIESTTGSKTTIIKDTRSRSRSKTSSRASSSYGGGISSEDVFGKRGAASAASESDTQSNTSSKTGHRSRRSSGAFGSFGRKGKEKAVERGISSADIFPPQRQASSSSSPSLANMLQGLRRADSNSGPQSPLLGAGSSSRSSSRASKGRGHPSSSGPSDVSENDSVLSGGSSAYRKRNRGFANVFKRKTSAERQEEEEHLQALADLRLRALALANADDDSPEVSQASAAQRGNAELLVRNMQGPRLSAIPLKRQESSATDSSAYSEQSPVASFAQNFSAPHRRDNDDAILHITGSKSHTGSSTRSAHSSQPSSSVLYTDAPLEPGYNATAGSDPGDTGDRTFLQDPATADVDASEDEAERKAILAESRRRSTLVPVNPGKQPSSVGTAPLTRHESDSQPARRPADGLWLTRNSFDGKERPKMLDSGDEADLDDEPIEPELLERRRSTLRAERASPIRAKAIGGPPTPSHRESQRERVNSSPSIRKVADSVMDESADISAITDAYAPPARSSSRPLSPEASRPVSPLKFRTSSFLARSESPSVSSPSGSTADKTFTAPRNREISISSHHTRERAESAVSGMLSGSPPPSPTQPRSHSKIFDELNHAITAAMEEARSSPNTSPRTALKSLPQPPLPEDATDTLVPSASIGSAPVSPRASIQKGGAGAGLGRRLSSEVLPTSPTRPVGHHRRTSSSDQIGKASSPPPAHRRTSSSHSIRSIGIARPAGLPRLPSHQEVHSKFDEEKARSLLVRNKPMPRAALLRDDLRRTKSPAERAVLYAQKINELATCESGLEYWILQVRQPSSRALARPSFNPSLRKGSDATFRGTISNSGPYQGGHAFREDNMSEAPFPLRKGSQDIYKARDITQRAPSIAPSTMVPSTIPYPGVYDNGQTLRTTSAMSNYSSASSNRQQANFAAAALNAAGLPSRSFFGLGRKASKRAPSISQQRQQRTGIDAGTSMSISAPLQPPPGPAPNTVGRNTALRPSGPRPSVSSSSDLPSHASSMSIQSLASSRQPHSTQFSPPLAGGQAMPSISSTGYSGAVSSEAESLTSMADILPMAPRDILLRYLRASKGDHLDAIGRYLDDERAGQL